MGGVKSCKKRRPTAGKLLLYGFVGTYGVIELTPEGLLDAGAQAGHVGGQTVGRVVDPNHVLDIVLASGEIAEDVDFCENEPGSLAGFVYADNDDDGLAEANELGISDVEVILYSSAGDEGCAYTDGSTRCVSL